MIVQAGRCSHQEALLLSLAASSFDSSEKFAGSEIKIEQGLREYRLEKTAGFMKRMKDWKIERTNEGED